MELEDFFETSILLQYYKNLLSEKQKKYMIEHFEEDYSLSEIANKYSISRQAVYENIKRGIKVLYEYEEKLKFRNKEKRIKNELQKINNKYNIIELEEIINEFSV
ncbi:YlxM family DNA-binding protein [Haliovirga abyssi]|uniref:UPF0122 protein HLVA_15620 n=1 Tax=Haliovirga abyssi TaxID=2996794 RepID=A0AAU9DFL0_9FUSO|nr:sigma factor-like helix-turn-helix DNA-binding protein [Haliovirga abyssi]BDU50993.1 UPF0122 protein [Haliovirga abyssi]